MSPPDGLEEKRSTDCRETQPSNREGGRGTRTLRLRSKPPADKPAFPGTPDGSRGGLVFKFNPGFPSAKGNNPGRLISSTAVITPELAGLGNEAGHHGKQRSQ